MLVKYRMLFIINKTHIIEGFPIFARCCMHLFYVFDRLFEALFYWVLELCECDGRRIRILVFSQFLVSSEQQIFLTFCDALAGSDKLLQYSVDIISRPLEASLLCQEADVFLEDIHIVVG